jgi:hypothetical protein
VSFSIYCVFVYADFRYSGAWLVSSAFMSVAFGSEILQGLSLAAGAPLLEETSLMKVE